MNQGAMTILRDMRDRNVMNSSNFHGIRTLQVSDYTYDKSREPRIKH